ncbi:hypothetical protein D9619_008996 [Psilocybe cf. subviscida]|uniref:Integrase zinc-binding domain-containing protein n=1 Tax=Psilocybe cf. subviscida TaxID=2480587 RepID=A0A8H5BTU6_9AGAR|nr:hypothetical protein D9619_008996 [Psilocybe cf. subviscida]
MSPARPSSRRNSSGGFKPYTRGVAQAQTASSSLNGTPPHAGSGSRFGSGTGSISPDGSASGNTSPGATRRGPQAGSPTGAHNTTSPPHTPQLSASHFNHNHTLNTPPPSTPTAPPPPPPPSHIAERPGFPTYAQYKQVETAYLQSLTPRRQGKALISQRMFDRIWDVLHQPDAPGETAQFRFWARKMFTLRTVPGGMGGVGGGTGPPTAAADFLGANMNAEPQEVLLHDNLLVAIQEQLYDLLCYCHGSTGHGGRDKTCALIRKHYTWVPKDLVSSFIKTCPTCIMKKCGGGGVGVGMNLNSGAGVGVGVNVNAGVMDRQQRQMEQQMQMQQIRQRQEEQQHRLQMHHHHHQQHQQEAGLPLPGMRDYFQNMYGMDLGAPGPSAHQQPHAQGVPWPMMDDNQAPASEHPMSPAAMSMSMSLSLSMSGSGSGSGSGSASISRSGSGAGSGSVSTPGLGSASSGSGSSGSMHEEDPLALDHEVMRARNGKPYLQGRGPAYPTHPMVREVALYKGLPNGWQYRHADYASAHAEFMAAKDALSAGSEDAHGGMDMQMDAVGMQRPRVPSILPLWGPDKFTQSEYEAIAAGNAEQLQGLSPVLPSTSGNHDTGHSPVLDGGMGGRPHFARGTQQMSLQYLLMNAPKESASGTGARPYTPQIDPVLLGYSSVATTGSGSSPALGATSASAPATGAGTGSHSGVSSSEFVGSASASLSSSARFPSSPSIKRAAAAPLRIHLEFPPPEKSFQALLAYRDSLGDGNLTPDSPLLGWGPGGANTSGSAGAGELYGHHSSGPPSLTYPASPSPSLRSDGSGGSQLSQLSAFRVSLVDDAGAPEGGDGGDGGAGVRDGTSHSNDSTPASSALPTPVDEYGSGAAAAVDIKGKRKMEFDVAETQTRLENELSEGIQIVLGLRNSTTA